MSNKGKQLRNDTAVAKQKLEMMFGGVHKSVRIEGTVFRREGKHVRAYNFGQQFGDAFDITSGDAEDFLKWAANRLINVKNPNGTNV